jgi:phosphoglycerol transferase MdoB-like AlkP superfamily enzyme
MKDFFRRLFPFVCLFLAFALAIRLSLLGRALADINFTANELVQIFLRGLWFDVTTAFWAILPIALVYLFVRRGFWEKRGGRILEWCLRLVFVYVLLFGAVGEHLFWTEFTARYNFIAVDYLVYTQEVIGNIVESYPIYWLLFALLVASSVVIWLCHKIWPVGGQGLPAIGKRARGFAVYAVLVAALFLMTNQARSQFGINAVANELSANGVYSLFYAFGHNEIDYARFYAKHDDAKVAANIQARLGLPAPPSAAAPWARDIKSKGPELRKNVIMVVMESHSAEFMKTFGSTAAISPVMDDLAKKGLLFAQTYATGTRTVRGLEALTLSLPPTPGQSILRREGNQNLYSLGFIFRDRGYDTKFIYGGYGYFDNMNAFFSANGFDIVDRAVMPKDEVNFANVWGIADEDMFARSVREADAAYARKQPFMHLIMTTSNHRPYTYPDGRIDLPSKTSGRAGGVKYADYSVGQLLRWAKDKPWFKDTLFVFVADHTHGASGKVELAPRKYHIPMIFYAPGFIKPKRIDTLTSQIDFAPILLGLLNFQYPSKFFGQDVLNDKTYCPRAFISTYQKVALAENDTLTILSPKNQVQQLSWPETEAVNSADAQAADDAIAYYQAASWWRDIYGRIPTAKEQSKGQ